MSVKRFFDGNTLTEVELPDAPFPGVVGTANENPFVSPQNPTGVDPKVLPIDAASLDNLKPTDGAERVTPKFPEPLPGSGEGPGIGQQSSDKVMIRDPWANNPNRSIEGMPEHLQSGEVGSALSPQVAKAAEVTNAKLEKADADTGETELESMTKAELADYVAQRGGDPANGTKAELLAEVKRLSRDDLI